MNNRLSGNNSLQAIMGAMKKDFPQGEKQDAGFRPHSRLFRSTPQHMDHTDSFTPRSMKKRRRFDPKSDESSPRSSESESLGRTPISVQSHRRLKVKSFSDDNKPAETPTNFDDMDIMKVDRMDITQAFPQKIYIETPKAFDDSKSENYAPTPIRTPNITNDNKSELNNYPTPALDSMKDLEEIATTPEANFNFIPTQIDTNQTLGPHHTVMATQEVESSQTQQITSIDNKFVAAAPAASSLMNLSEDESHADCETPRISSVRPPQKSTFGTPMSFTASTPVLFADGGSQPTPPTAKRISNNEMSHKVVAADNVANETNIRSAHSISEQIFSTNHSNTLADLSVNAAYKAIVPDVILPSTINDFTVNLNPESEIIFNETTTPDIIIDQTNSHSYTPILFSATEVTAQNVNLSGTQNKSTIDNCHAAAPAASSLMNLNTTRLSSVVQSASDDNKFVAAAPAASSLKNVDLVTPASFKPVDSSPLLFSSPKSLNLNFSYNVAQEPSTPLVTDSCTDVPVPDTPATPKRAAVDPAAAFKGLISPGTPRTPRQPPNLATIAITPPKSALKKKTVVSSDVGADISMNQTTQISVTPKKTRFGGAETVWQDINSNYRLVTEVVASPWTWAPRHWLDSSGKQFAAGKQISVFCVSKLKPPNELYDNGNAAYPKNHVCRVSLLLPPTHPKIPKILIGTAGTEDIITLCIQNNMISSVELSSWHGISISGKSSNFNRSPTAYCPSGELSEFVSVARLCWVRWLRGYLSKSKDINSQLRKLSAALLARQHLDRILMEICDEHQNCSIKLFKSSEHNLDMLNFGKAIDDENCTLVEITVSALCPIRKLNGKHMGTFINTVLDLEIMLENISCVYVPNLEPPTDSKSRFAHFALLQSIKAVGVSTYGPEEYLHMLPPSVELAFFNSSGPHRWMRSSKSNGGAMVALSLKDRSVLDIACKHWDSFTNGEGPENRPVIFGSGPLYEVDLQGSMKEFEF